MTEFSQTLTASAPAPSAPTVARASTLENQLKREELLASIRAIPSRLVVVTGTGVTLQSVGSAPGTEVASWPGLLTNGLERCRGKGLIDAADAEVVAMLIKQRKSEHFITAAQMIHDCMASSTNERLLWMKDTIGSLKVVEPRLIKAILSLNGLVGTLNYDSTIHQVSGRPPLHWREQGKINPRETRHAIDYILHFHGLYDALDSIILDRRSYDEISNHKQMRDLLQHFARFHTMVFIGCRQTFLDPDFQTLLAWAQIGLDGLDHRHFVLCRVSEEAELQAELKFYGYLTPLVYGSDYADLAPFLESLATEALGVTATTNPPTLRPSAAFLPVNARRPTDIWKRQSRR
jgi:hypothetical protein